VRCRRCTTSSPASYVRDTVDLATFRLVENLPAVPARLEREITADPVRFRTVSAGGW
jgi:hypothetical protein